MTTNQSDYLFGTSDNNNQDTSFAWDTTLLPPIEKKQWTIAAIHPDRAKLSCVSHAFCNAIEVFLNEIGESAELCRETVAATSEMNENDVSRVMHSIYTDGVKALIDDGKVRRVTRYERITGPHIIDAIRVALFCNLIPVVCIRIDAKFYHLHGNTYEDQVAFFGDKTVEGDDLYCAALVGVNHEKRRVALVGARGFSFGINGHFVIGYDYLLANVVDIFIVREVNNIRAAIPEELYIRNVPTVEVKIKPKSIWSKFLSLFN